MIPGHLLKSNEIDLPQAISRSKYPTIVSAEEDYLEYDACCRTDGGEIFGIYSMPKI